MCTSKAHTVLFLVDGMFTGALVFVCESREWMLLVRHVLDKLLAPLTAGLRNSPLLVRVVYASLLSS